ncbi:DUF4184 family protein [Streptomyces sp. NPDC001940]
MWWWYVSAVLGATTHVVWDAFTHPRAHPRRRRRHGLRGRRARPRPAPLHHGGGGSGSPLPRRPG